MPLTYRRPGQVCVEHTLDVPLDHDDSAGPRLEVFAREVVSPAHAGKDLPTLLFLQGGPGCAADRPSSGAAWLDAALRDYRVVLLDQRGTGRSTPVNRQSLAGRTAADQAAYLRHFRADAIVRDAELVRRHLQGDRPWTVLGQSYGGFCALTYLSIAPHALTGVMIAGGLPSLTATADEIYREAYPRAIAANQQFFARYPADRKLARQVVDHLADTDARLPTGERLTAQRFQMLGTTFGATGTFDTLHHLLETAFIGSAGRPVLSDAFLRGTDAIVSMADHPLYALMQETIYCQGRAAGWAAHRVRSEFDQFDPHNGEVNFTTEMFYPWVFEQDPALSPLRDCAEALAAYDGWAALYNVDTLADNLVPGAAVVYADDLYVSRTHSLQTAAIVGNLRAWVTNEHAHDALKTHSQVFERLHAMIGGEL
jgi:pimeloyl-ACP methyl ester carboxylesterase